MKHLLLSALLLSASTASAQEDPEVRRLRTTVEKLAQKNAWDGVERSYNSITELGGTDHAPTVLLAAEAARNRGDVTARVERLELAYRIEANSDVDAQLKAVGGEFGRVELSCKGPCPALVPKVEPFRPDLKNAIEYASAQIGETSRFTGYVPIGQYHFGHRDLEVIAGQAPLVVESTTKAAKLKGLFDEINLPPTVTQGKKTQLMLNGAGVHSPDNEIEYVGALYLKGPDGSAEHVINSTGPKRILIHWLTSRSHQDHSDFFGPAFKLADPEETAWGDEQLFLMLVSKVEPGDRIIFDWEPKKKAVRVWVNDEDQGDIDGEVFMRILWTVFLGPNAPSEDLKQGMLGKL